VAWNAPREVVGLFGILKAGGAYVFLDPAYPKERLIFMLGCASAVDSATAVEGLPDRGTRVVYHDCWETTPTKVRRT